MKYEDVQDILTLLKTGYPQSFSSYTAKSGQLLLDIWYEGLKMYPSSLVLKAVKTIMLNDSRDFAPNIGQIRRKVADLVTDNAEVASEEAWIQVKKILPKMLNLDGYNREDAIHDQVLYDTLPSEVKSVYTLREIYTLCNNDPHDNDVYEKNKFRTAYQSIRAQNIDRALMDGKLLTVAKKERLEALGISPETLAIEMKDVK